MSSNRQYQHQKPFAELERNNLLDLPGRFKNGDISKASVDIKVRKNLKRKSSTDCMNDTSYKQTEKILTSKMKKKTINSLADDFDFLPEWREENDLSYPYANKVVRKKNKRKQQKGFTCYRCEKFYGGNQELK